ncbi:MAG: tryptophan--tRNA ligase [Candidatus Thiodiazotropha sp. (ex Lucinoma annulata)]|nr:tryptophan--tRNA ligase [Candidatus Thiodiazotropha sp. (ex Lucinoma borealis)]MCU7839650.1 tryptophan--tRNA ligase [Candidatus Thiodiazotropha sp. (ex Troendleina suluensis)]MCU7870188.1 tryptophan--tRNA ligase [Candidatus Thiodiazotropha sp. (ex Lucinoma borealis)]MCU7871443.1 tryptophan--tRNA ligase [Candidatus Thiodiazotropha sp. (ex Lucinoma borealis)]MCU7885758.1 tryptophan--tRNA ligase [Candidatus Thiodiazotropha sp. (ex Lucinoma annulata)]
MRPTGRLHLGHYHGVLKNWVELQHQHECFFFVADWHALTTHYDDPSIIPASIWDMVIDWLAAGVDSESATLFIQSLVPEHAELHLLLSMITPLGWLERVPSYKDQQEKLKEKDLATYGFLGYPLLQSADILIYRASQVPVGEDQVAHVELTREVARRFNHLYGLEPNFEEHAESARKKMGKKAAKQYSQLRRAYQEQGDLQALETGRGLLEAQQNISVEERERLLGYLEGSGRMILTEPQSLLTKASKMPGLDGQKMSKSYENTISLRDTPADVENRLKRMPTDTNRVRRTDPGDPEKCPVWQFHLIYSDEGTRAWVEEGCRTAGIGCLDCKAPVIESVLNELKPMQQRAAEFEAEPELVKRIVREGSEKARAVAQETMQEVRQVMSLKSFE